jgi:hypothetical protein
MTPGTTGGTTGPLRRAPSCPQPAFDAASEPLPWHRDRSAGTRVRFRWARNEDG